MKSFQLHSTDTSPLLGTDYTDADDEFDQTPKWQTGSLVRVLLILGMIGLILVAARYSPQLGNAREGKSIYQFVETVPPRQCIKAVAPAHNRICIHMGTRQFASLELPAGGTSFLQGVRFTHVKGSVKPRGCKACTSGNWGWTEISGCDAFMVGVTDVLNNQLFPIAGQTENIDKINSIGYSLQSGSISDPTLELVGPTYLIHSLPQWFPPPEMPPQAPVPVPPSGTASPSASPTKAPTDAPTVNRWASIRFWDRYAFLNPGKPPINFGTICADVEFLYDTCIAIGRRYVSGETLVANVTFEKDEGSIEKEATTSSLKWNEYQFEDGVLSDLERLFDGRANSSSSSSSMCQHWIDQGQGEHASVASFARYSLDLMGAGSPSDLVSRSQVASLDEVRHAQIAWAIASVCLGTQIEPSPFPEHSIDVSKDVDKLSVSTAIYGAIEETLSAGLMMFRSQQLKRRGFKNLADVLMEISRDEMSHAQLAWDVLAWIRDENNGDMKKGSVFEEKWWEEKKKSYANDGIGEISCSMGDSDDLWSDEHLVRVNNVVWKSVVDPMVDKLMGGEQSGKNLDVAGALTDVTF